MKNQRAVYESMKKELIQSIKVAKAQLKSLEKEYGDDQTFQQEVNIRNAKTLVCNLSEAYKSVTNLVTFL